jgi:curved DNA-binding protein CbpA
MNRITRAYDILSNPESKKEYDSSSKVLVNFQSKATNITKDNFALLVLKSHSPWIIFVYDFSKHSNSGLNGFWDEFINKNSFSNFGSMTQSTYNKTVG